MKRFVSTVSFATFVALVYIYLCGSAAAQEAGATDYGARTQEQLSSLRAGNGVEAAEALIALTRTPDDTMRNMTALAAIARETQDPMDADVMLRRHAPKPFWGDYTTKSSLILGRVATSLSTSTSETDIDQGLNQFRPFVLDAVAGEIAGISPKQALEAYYHAAFSPFGYEYLSPPQVASADQVLNTLLASLVDPNPRISQVAHMGIVSAAYLLPDRRERLINELRSRLGREAGEEARAGVERFLNSYGEPVPRDIFLSVFEKSDEELLDHVRGMGSMWLLHLQTLCDRLEDSTDRDEIALELLSDPSIAPRHWGLIIPKPISKDASQSEKEFVDVLIGFIESEIAAAEGESSIYDWTVQALRGLIYTKDNRRSIVWGPSAGVEGELQEFAPYGRDRVVRALLGALNANNLHLQYMAAGAVKEIAWLGAEPARLALEQLLARKEQLEQEYALSPPNDTRPSKGNWNEHPERWVYDPVIDAINESKKAQAAFSNLEHVSVMEPPMTIGKEPRQNLERL